jgi:hypothetical protein
VKPLDPIRAAWELARLGVLTRFRLGGAYWRWRRSTALGSWNPGRAGLIRAAIEYGAWVWRMRRL